MADKLKYIVALIVMVGAMAGYYYYGEQSALLRTLVLLAAAGVSVAIMLQTDIGRRAWVFAGDSRNEIRKVVWPTRKETVQTTVIVVVMVFVVATLLWIFDMFLMWAVKFLTGQGG